MNTLHLLAELHILAPMAHFEIHVLNYNGSHHLTRCLEALQRLDPGRHSFHVNLVDNGSLDNSKQLVETNFPKVSFVALERNLGFSQGNNAGVRTAAARRAALGCAVQDYDVFLNNDTAVDREWLLQAAAAFEHAPQIGIVGSQSLFMDHFAALRITTSPAFFPSRLGSGDTRRLGCFLSQPPFGTNVVPAPARMRYRGAHAGESGGRWLSDDSTIFIPVADVDQRCEFALRLSFSQDQAQRIQVRFFNAAAQQPFDQREYTHGEEHSLNYVFQPREFVRVVQNAGSFITPDWDAGDMLSGEIDQGGTCAAHEVQAVCGVSLFIRHGLFQELGGFDPNYFAYFEDTDLCVRARLKGYRCMLAPQSRLYHLHAGSSGGEWSPQFSRLVAWSHLLFTSKFAPPAVWRKRLADLRRAARDQFATYEATRSLDNTPQLRAYLQYLKRPGLFLGNRLKRALNCAALESVLQLPEQAASESCPAKAA